ncbi:MAG: type IV pilin-like G/H family protein, partial [Synechococcales bacterium]|nr:type IV pilin-like G/H family protein [Synechococcales bacterium]
RHSTMDTLPPLPNSSRRLFQRSPRSFQTGLVLWQVVLGLAIAGGALLLVLPNWLNSVVGCGNKARSAEARLTLGGMNRLQEANYLEKGQFVSTMAQMMALGGINPSSNYTYQVRSMSQSAMSQSAMSQSVISPGSVSPVPAAQPQVNQTVPPRLVRGMVHYAEVRAERLVQQKSFLGWQWQEPSPHQYYNFVSAVISRWDAQGRPGTIAILCQAEQPGNQPVSEPLYQGGVLTCGAATKEVK